MTEHQVQQEKISKALEELRKAREDLRGKIAVLGKDAKGVLADTENLVRKAEARILEVGENSLKELSLALIRVRDRVAKLREAEKKEEEKKPTTPPAA
jgi:molecular chaperone GrpE (heat shock protein)